MKHIVGALVELAKIGVQIFVTTHSYFLLQELSLMAQYEKDKANIGFNFISLYEDEKDRTVHSETASQVYDLNHNSIIEEFESLYNREQEKLYED